MKKKALVVVFGDLARSPRMQYHCLSLAKNDIDVSVIANGDEELKELPSGNIKQYLMRTNVDFRKYIPSVLAYIVKTIWLTMLLVYHLFLVPIPNFILVQNPPSIPTLPVLYIYSKLVRTHLVVDWHNYGFTILSLGLGKSHPLVKLMRFIEIQFGKRADAGFCVSKAMQEDLIKTFNINYPLKVLYDKPPNRFQPMSLDEQIKFLEDNLNELPRKFRDVISPIEKRSHNALIVSSTSWTEDEDFGILLDSFIKYERWIRYELDCRLDLPKIICVITGKGPLKEYYAKRIEELELCQVEFVLPWLEAEHYPKLIALSDLCVSLHKSSSGVDLPMKVVDFFGCGVPVLAYKYPAINELVVEERYGLTFENSEELFEHLKRMLTRLTARSETSELNCFRNNIKEEFLKLRWDENWNQVAKPLLSDL